MKNWNWKRFFTYAISIILFLSVFFIPYLLKDINEFFNKKFGNIPLTSYMTCVATLFTGILAIVISVLALQISRKADTRDQQKNRLMINTTKRAVREYLKGNSSTISDITKNVADKSMLAKPDSFDRDLAILHAYSVITKEQYQLCRKISHDMQAIINAKTPADAINLSQQFLKDYTDQTTPFYQENDIFRELLHNLEEEE